MFKEIYEVPDEASTRTDLQVFKNSIYSYLYKQVYDSKIFEYRYEGYMDAENGKVFDALSYIDAVNCTPQKEKLIAYYANSSISNLAYLYTLKEPAIGTVILINTKEIFESELSNYTGIKYLEAAQEALKESSSHYLKLFTGPFNHALYVATDKQLKLQTIYKIKQLQNTMDENYVTNFNPLTKEIYKALVDHNVYILNTSIEAILNSKEFKERYFTTFLNEFKSITSDEVEDVKKQLKNNHNSLLYWENEIAKIGTEIRKLNTRLQVIQKEEKTEEEIKDLYKFLNKNPYITDYKLSNGMLNLTYNAPLIYYSDYAVEAVAGAYEYEEKDIIDIFLKKRFQLYTSCILKFNLYDFRVSVHYIDRCDCEYITHPHINEYGCFGNHREAIEDACMSKNYIGAIDQISQAVLNLNFYDSCVIDHLMTVLTDEESGSYEGDKLTWYDTETGEMISTFEAIRRNKNEETYTE